MPKVLQIIQSHKSELFGIHLCLAGYEILAFEKPCLHYQKISTESRLIYTVGKWKRANRKHATIYVIFSRKVRT